MPKKMTEFAYYLDADKELNKIALDNFEVFNQRSSGWQWFFIVIIAIKVLALLARM